MIGAFVNDKKVNIDYILHNKDRVKVLTDSLSCGPSNEWLDYTKTTNDKRKIKEFKKV